MLDLFPFWKIVYNKCNYLIYAIFEMGERA